ncbi:MAG: ATP-dependent DNA helicase [Actinobacteria bacterium]|nr:ATP-dependent DNA helicase [Actinomycetota bacterium]
MNARSASPDTAAVSVSDALAARPTFAVLKGRHNYVCMDKLNRDVPEDDSDAALFETPRSALGRQAKALRDWADRTATGDRDELTDAVPAQLWRAVSVQRRECVGVAKCAYGQECFVESARDTAREADIVVTNHAMLAVHLIEQIPVLPEHDAIIIDEAHELVDRTTSSATVELSGAAVDRAATRAGRLLEPDLVDRVTEAAELLSTALDGLVDSPTATVQLRELPGELFLALTRVRDATSRAVAALTTEHEGGAEDAAARQRARGALEEAHDTAGALLAMSQRDVVWVSATQRGSAAAHLAPLSVAAMLRERLFADRAVVLTSATVTLGGSFNPLAQSVGLNIEPAADFEALDVGSPFDHRRQGILYCPAHLPPPGPDGPSGAVLAELADLMQAAGGRTLALFSSWRAVESAAEYLQAAFTQRGLDSSIDLIVQQRGDAVGQLVERFAADETSCLLGTLSLWQGVDVPGASCSLVTIDRVPFPRPDEPVTSARSRVADESGGNGFMSVSLPRAALLLAQGAGRLVRSSDDRGVIAVLDSRLANARYGGYLRSSLPPYWWTTDGNSVRDALTRLNFELTPDATR